MPGFPARLAWSRMCNMMACEPTLRIEFAEEPEVQPEHPPQQTEPASQSTSDYARIEELLNRCWDELDGIELNVKLTDMIRLLEFKHKLASSAEAEREFWRLINTIRRDELAHLGDVNNTEPDK
ncbi:MAG: hypothetical protein GF341_10040 [candidate division Zixibacteria bacterium]|nr:hypothetical protein [candidate division Zixibacteria bacterium]